MGIVTTVAVWMAAAGMQPTADVACDRVDVVEINHYYDEKGQLVLDQLIFYDWSPKKHRYDVRAWRLLKTPVQLPRRDHVSKQYVAIWRDGDMMRKVYAKALRESWTQYDPEMVERQFLARDKRRDLQKLILTVRKPAQQPTAPVRAPGTTGTVTRVVANR